jgi:hypothetical protein
MMEKFAFETFKASKDIAIERGAYSLFPGSEYSK